MNSASSWPEPIAILLMVLFSFVGGAAAYRASAHIAVHDAHRCGAADGCAGVRARCADVLMGIIALFMIVWGMQLVRATWDQTIAEFPWLSVGVTYLPIPVGGAGHAALRASSGCWLGSPPADRS